jgi:hypothetical protein
LPALSAFNLRKYLTDPAGVWYNRRPTGKYFHRSTTWWSALISSNYYWSVGAGEDLTKLHLIRGNLQIRLDIVPVLVYNGAGQILHSTTTAPPAQSASENEKQVANETHSHSTALEGLNENHSYLPLRRVRRRKSLILKGFFGYKEFSSYANLILKKC